MTQDEDVLTYALFPKVALDFFKERAAGFPAKKAAAEKKAEEKAAAAAPVPKAEEKSAAAAVKIVPLPAPFLGSYPGVVGEEAAQYIDPAPRAGDRIEGEAVYNGSTLKYQIDCLG